MPVRSTRRGYVTTRNNVEHWCIHEDEPGYTHRCICTRGKNHVELYKLEKPENQPTLF